MGTKKESKQSQRGTCLLYVILLVIVVGAVGFASVHWFMSTEAGKLVSSMRNVTVTSRGFHREYKSLKDAGEPVTTDAVLGEPIPNEENAAFHLACAAVYSRRICGKSGKDEVQDFLNDVIDSERIDEIEALNENDLRSGMQTELERFLECERSRPVFKHLSVFGMYDLIRPERLLREEALEALENDNIELVANNALKILKIGRIASYEPGPRRFNYVHHCIASGVKLMHKAMSEGSLPEELHAKLDRELALLNSKEPLVQRVQLDRAIYLQSRLEGKTIRMVWAFADQEKMVKWFNHHVALANEPWSQYWPNHNSGLFEDEYRTCRATFDAYTVAHQYHNRCISLVRSLIVFSAIKRQEAAHGPISAAAIDQLKLSKPEITDPHRGLSLQIEKQANRWKIFSPGIPKEGELNFIDWTCLDMRFKRNVIGVSPDDPWFDIFNRKKDETNPKTSADAD